MNTALIQKIGQELIKRNWKIATAESCTGGGLAYAITSLEGSSNWFDRGFVTYSNIAKQEVLGVNPITIETSGAVGEQTAKEMAEGVLKNSAAQISIAITGIAGPGGGSQDKPVGTVWFAWAGSSFKTQTKLKFFSGNRQEIRDQATLFALVALDELLKFLT